MVVKCPLLEGVGLFALLLEYSGSAQRPKAEKGESVVRAALALLCSPPGAPTGSSPWPRTPGLCRSPAVSQADASLVVCGVSSVSFTCVQVHIVPAQGG